MQKQVLGKKYIIEKTSSKWRCFFCKKSDGYNVKKKEQCSI